MELKNTEHELNEMLVIYESLRRSDHWSTNNGTGSTDVLLPALEWPETHPSRSVILEHEQDDSFHKYQSETELLAALEDLKTAKFPPLLARMEKMGKRLAERDPITDAPRYGAKTAERVANVLVLHTALKRATWVAFGLELVEDEAAGAGVTGDTEAAGAKSNDNSSNAVSQLRSAVGAQQESLKQMESQAEQQRQREQAQQLAAEEEQRQQAEAERQRLEEARRQEDADIAQRAEQLRQAQRDERNAIAQAQQDWLDSIPKGPAGLRQQIQILKDDTESDPVAQKAALAALLQLFTQMNTHPEEVKFRRIRRDHPKFHQDIGRHKGGREILIAAKFKLVTLDDVPCFYSKEPNLETDMDGWSDWFDNIKANLEVVKEMQ